MIKYYLYIRDTDHRLYKIDYEQERWCNLLNGRNGTLGIEHLNKTWWDSNEYVTELSENEVAVELLKNG